MKYFVFVMCLATSASVGHAASFDIHVGEEAVGVALSSSNSEAGPGVEIAALRNDDDDITVASGGVFVSGTRGVIEARLGAKAYAADLDNFEGYGLALGGQVSVPLAAGISINGGLYFGPSSLAFSDVDGYQEWYVGASFDVVENATLAAGVGSFEIETESGREVEVDDGFFVRMKLGF
jgi:YfaZ precursor